MSTLTKFFTHEDIENLLRPYANRGWLKRWEEAKAQRPKWIYIIRDFPIQDPKVEMIVEDIVRALEPKSEKKSAVRMEMQKLESEGKLRMDTPEEEEYWEKRLQEERDAQEKWEKEDREARMKQRELDLNHLEKKEEGETLEPVAPPTQPSEEEQKQKEFIPKPPPEKETPVRMPTIKSITGDGKEIYNKDGVKKKEALDTLDGLPKDAIERLNLRGVYNVEDLKTMDLGQAKSVLGGTLYKKFESYFTTKQS